MIKLTLNLEYQLPPLSKPNMMATTDFEIDILVMNVNMNILIQVIEPKLNDISHYTFSLLPT
jgi:hypothetical protein